MTKDEALAMALEALEESVDLVQDAYDTDWRQGLPTRKKQLDAEKIALDNHKKAIDAIKESLEEPQATHSEDCYKWHHKCAIAMIERGKSA